MTEKYHILPSGAVALHGPLGRKLKQSAANRLKKIDYKNLVRPFRERNEDDGMWRCEFWGKVVRSAINTWYSTRDPELLDILRATVRDIISTQAPDGSISTYPDSARMTFWDIWGRKYVLLGLLRYYEFVEQDPAVRTACIRLLENVMTLMGPSARPLTKSGTHGGLPAASILGGVVGVWRMTGDPKFADYARWIISTGCSSRHDIFQVARMGFDPRNMSNGKAYEMMSCFQGLADFAMEAPSELYEETVRVFYNAVRTQEVYITGIAGMGESGEYWGGGAVNQSCDSPRGELGETCVTATWIHYCDRVLRLLGEPSAAGELERVFYNAVLGAVTPDGSWWTHANPTPLTGGGYKRRAPDQIGLICGKPFGHDCCLAQGPEALAFAPLLAALGADDGLALNFYEDMDVNFSAPSGNPVRVSVRGNYPYSNRVRIEVRCGTPERFALRLHIPEYWNEKSSVVLPDGEKAPRVCPNEYCVLEREWHDGDAVELTFDFSVKQHLSADGFYTAYTRGPLVLAEDSRLTNGIPETEKENFAVLENVGGRILCDYASAGGLFCPENTLRVWMKNPR